MALIDCPECGNSVSDTADACPKCGFAVRRHLIREAVAQHGESGGDDANASFYSGTPSASSDKDDRQAPEAEPSSHSQWTRYAKASMLVLIPCELLLVVDTVLRGKIVLMSVDSFVISLPGGIGNFIGTNILVIFTLFAKDKDSRLPLAAVMASITVIIVAIFYLTLM